MKARELVGREKYEEFGRQLGVDLVNNPELAMEPEAAWKILSLGMTEGLFTGKRLYDYIPHEGYQAADYDNARRIIFDPSDPDVSPDKSQEIARNAEKFEAILKASLDTPAASTQGPASVR